MNDMVRRLYLVRHAKSSWDHAGLEDRERPLNDRGNRDAPEMGRRMRAQGHRPDHIISSPAQRAHRTARHLASVLEFDAADIEIAPDFYFKGTHGMLDVVQRIDDRFSQVMLVGHNPTMTELVRVLAGTGPVNMPTCAIAIVDLPMESWGLIRDTAGDLLGYDRPKGRGQFTTELD